MLSSIVCRSTQHNLEGGRWRRWQQAVSADIEFCINFHFKSNQLFILSPSPLLAAAMNWVCLWKLAVHTVLLLHQRNKKQQQREKFENVPACHIRERAVLKVSHTDHCQYIIILSKYGTQTLYKSFQQNDWFQQAHQHDDNDAAVFFRKVQKTSVQRIRRWSAKKTTTNTKKTFGHALGVGWDIATLCSLFRQECEYAMTMRRCENSIEYFE